MPHLNMDPELTAGLPHGDEDGGNLDQPPMIVDEQGRIEQPQDVSQPNEPPVPVVEAPAEVVEAVEEPKPRARRKPYYQQGDKS